MIRGREGKLAGNRTNPSSPDLDAQRLLYTRGLDHLRVSMDTAQVFEGCVAVKREVWRDMMDTLDGLREISSTLE